MNKKSIIVPIFLLMFLSVSLYVVNGFGFFIQPQLYAPIVITNSTAISPVQYNAFYGENFSYAGLANWTKGGTWETFNFTFNLSDRAANINQIVINITSLPTGSQVALFASPDNATIINGTLTPFNSTFAWTTSIVSSTASNISVNASSAAHANSGLNTLAGNNLTSVSMIFNIYVGGNNTETVHNWSIFTHNATGVLGGIGSAQIRTGIDGRAPRLISMNITDGIRTITTGFTSSNYLSNSTEVNISVTVEDWNIDRLILIYNSTGGTINLTAVRNELYANVSAHPTNATYFQGRDRNNAVINGILVENTTKSADDPGSMWFTRSTGEFAERSNLSNSTAIRPTWRFNITGANWGWAGGSSVGQFNWVFVVYDLLNNSEIINASNGDNFIVQNDPLAPSMSIAEPSDTVKDVYGTIKYSCDCSDTGSGIDTCKTKLTKPSGATIIKSGDNTEHTFTAGDLNEAGTYSVTCDAKDNVGNTKTSGAKTFLVQYSSAATGGGGSAGGGGGGSGGEAVTVVSEAIGSGVTKEIGALTETQITQISEGGAVSFAIGTTAHTAKVLTVGTDSVTVEISSTPKQVTVKIGETANVDTDDNGVDDLTVTLNGITNGKADITFKNLLAPPAKETTTTTTIAQPPEVVTGEKKTSLTWLWVVIAIIVIIIIVVVIRKKK